jgi:hypothetical protein
MNWVMLAARPTLGERAALLYEERFSLQRLVDRITSKGAAAETARPQVRHEESASRTGIYIET